MNLPEFAVRHKPVVLTLVLILIAWGVISFQTMPRREDPEYTVRTCAVITPWPGAPAQKVEELVTDKLEKALDTIEEVDVVRSTSTNGLSEIYVDVEDWVSGDSIDNAWDKVRAEVSRVSMPDPNIRAIV
ncbi:efflux RND transporter permease subunit, partial [Planctomicrobium sp.]|nr:efflux RND transporter permease subunit [Planctomicrobium sp.]